MMNPDNTKLRLLGMFSAFPSFQRSKDQMDLTLEAYVLALSNFHDVDIASGCKRAMQNGGPFPPSSAELYKIVADEAASRERWEDYRRQPIRGPQPRLPRPKHDYTAAELADFSLDINTNGRPYVMREVNGQLLTIPPGYPGAGKKAEYGYVTPSEAKTYTQGSQVPRAFSEAAE